MQPAPPTKSSNAAPAAKPAAAPPQRRPDHFKISDGKALAELPDRIILHAPEKWGKTSFAAQFPDPLFVMTRGEDGLLTLIKSGQLGPVPHVEECVEDWSKLLLILNEINVQGTPHRTLIIDTLNGAERLCHEHTCHKHFDNDWGEKGFLAFHRGYELSIPYWLELLQVLDALRKKGKRIIALCHTRVATFKNPDGPDFDRYEPDMHKKTWSATHKWADMILFGMFETFVETKDKKATKGKGSGGQTRLLLTERHAAYDAGNRHGLPPEIELGDSPGDAYQAFHKALSKKGSE